MKSQKSLESNKTFQNMLALWGGEDCESVVDSKAHVLRMEASFKRALSQTPVNHQEKQVLIYASEIDSYVLLIAGRILGLTDGLEVIAKVAGGGLNNSVEAREALTAIYLFVISLSEFNRTTLKLSQLSSEKVKSIYDSVLEGKL